MATYLGPLVGGRINQYANTAGQIYYQDTVTGTTSYAIPNGFQDGAGDNWTLDTTKGWPQWNNSRTGRAVLINPNPPPPQTYLDDINVKAVLDLLVRVPDSGEHIYRRPIGDILRFIFPSNEGYSIVQETVSVNTEPEFCLFKVCQRSGETLYQYEYMLVESKKLGEAWEPTENHLHNHLEVNGNDSKNCYGMVQIGLHVQFYKYERFSFSKVGGRMHLINDANNVVACGRNIKENPLSFV
ncbi:uncharacterized protein K460DRAFT_421469 [Cucurbitaria berberidis CBS 394.84]|uniref:WW domain-containing protein n=1 Tax=Cucurbitaria berberidis CBS 394.84 TaxID=1168544 RepID=A0A9P4L3P2_9PLEO|nr:uncharacterized protein K460DRAFT_421469 [Cucurbitaria berberidis CBS 394.84]KAF1840529.1 hypothetical protein K460DRAFT_421469 [Cucurbitaria berberidis CBS 394.84]